MNRFIFESYVETALWSSDLDDFSISDLSDQAKSRMMDVLTDFFKIAEKPLSGLLEGECEDYEYCSTQISPDLWLTQNHHGSGFWDGDYPKPYGNILTDLAHSMGEMELYQGDDGLLYVFG
jgi:hypothetical protein